MRKFMKTFHKYLGLPGAIIFLYMSFTGILLNNPKLISAFNAPEFLLPKDMKMVNWGRGGAQVFCDLPDGSLLFGGKIGLHKVDKISDTVTDLTDALPHSVARGEVTALIRQDNHLFAGTVSGLYEARYPKLKWRQTLEKHAIISFLTLLSGVPLIIRIKKNKRKKT